MNMARIFRFLFASIYVLSLFVGSPGLLMSEPSPAADASLPLRDLAVPEDMGKVQERFSGKNPRTIIQIQDVHAHAAAQQNIASILERLRTVFEIEKVALEGAWSSTDLPKSRAITTSREKQLLAQSLLDDDRISGPVYAAIMSPQPITLVGVEEKAAYEKNRAVFLGHLAAVKEIDVKLAAYHGRLQELQKAAWNPKLLTFANAFGQFREFPDLAKFFPVLMEGAEVHGIPIDDLGQIVLVRDIMAIEKFLQKDQLTQEIKHLMRDYKNTPWTLEELVRGGKIPPEKLGYYPEIKKMTKLFKMRDQISLRDLTVQIETLTGRILGKLIQKPDEQGFWDQTERFYLAKRLLLLQASPADVKDYENDKGLLDAELAEAGLSEALLISTHFYDIVRQRDAIFFDKLMNDAALAGNVVIVTGGFHTDGLSQHFRDAGISYITITPDLSGGTMNEKLYNERMKERTASSPPEVKSETTPNPTSGVGKGLKAVSSSTLSELRNAIAWVDDKFPPSYEALLQTKDVRQAKKVFLGGTVTVPRSAKISQLAREGKIVRENKEGPAVTASELRVSEFSAKPRTEQLEAVTGWLAQGPERREKAMLVSSVGILAKMLSEERTARLLEEAVQGGGIIALAQDVPATEMPEIFTSMRGIDRFEAKDIETLIGTAPRFQRLAKKHPFAIMQNGRAGGAYVVLPEKPVSLVLFRIITLNPSLYQAAKDPAFLALLEDLVSEIISKELSGKSA